MTIVLAMLSLPILVSSNIRRTIFTCKNLRQQPNVHKILPLMQRNLQLCWVLNFQAAAVALESTSLSDYIYEYEGLPVAGKKKDLPKNFKPIVLKPIASKMLVDKMWFQDYPMQIIMCI